MKTIAWETASQIALMNYSKDVGEQSINIYVILVKGDICNQAHIWQKVAVVMRNRCLH